MFQTIKHIIVVSHTHWDPEWYCTFEEYRIRLSDFMEKLLFTLETNPDFHSFTFDGQVAPLESYLQVFPENKQRITKLVKKEKLLVGPWYTMPDEYMNGPEVLIRNLLIGTMLAKELGGVMKVGYLPDIAGHISQLPQILKGFGIECAVLWRGVAGYPETEKTEFVWRGADGTEMLVVHLPWGYANDDRLFRDTEFTIRKIRELIERQKDRNATSYMLLMSGGDHQKPHPLTPEIIKKINSMNLDFKIEHGDILKYVERVKGELRNPKIHIGEMRRTETSFVLPGVLTTRTPLKKMHFKTEVLLIHWLEPFSTIAWLLGCKYPINIIRYAWKLFLQNTFHDVIYGAHTDGVYQDAVNRYKRCQEVARWLTLVALYEIAERINTEGWYKAIIIFNPNNWDRTDIVETILDIPKRDAVESFRIIDDNGKEVVYQIVGREEIRKYESERGVMDYFPSTVEEIMEYKIGEPVVRYKLLLLAENVPALGYKAYRVEPSVVRKDNTFLKKVRILCRAIENDLIKVEVHNGGSLTIIDKSTNSVYSNLNIIEDRGDVGDNYTHQQPVRDVVVTNLSGEDSFTILENGPLRSTIRIDMKLVLPKSASSDGCSRSKETVICPLSIYISLGALSPRVDVRIIFDNRAKDHHLRVGFFPTILADKIYVGGHFDIIKREITLPEAHGWLEKPSSFQPFRNFVVLKEKDKDRGIAIFTRGLLAYEAIGSPYPAVYVTLLRSTGWLSKEGLEERSNFPAGPILPTPGAQCLGKSSFEYAIYPFSPSATLDEVYRLAKEYICPLQGFSISGKEGSLPTRFSFCKVKGSFISALKKSENDDAVILRLYNVRDETSLTEIDFFKPMKKIEQVTLSEEALEKTTNNIRIIDDHRVSLAIPAKKIVTLKVLCGENNKNLS